MDRSIKWNRRGWQIIFHGSNGCGCGFYKRKRTLESHDRWTSGGGLQLLVPLLIKILRA